MKTLFLLSCIIALSNALPRNIRSKYGYYLDSEGYAHPDKETEMKRLHSSVAAKAKTTIQASSASSYCRSVFSSEAYVHLCQDAIAGKDKDDFCVTSNTRRCCENDEEARMEEHDISFEHFSATLYFNTILKPNFDIGRCFILDEANNDISSCQGCRDEDCVEPACIKNTRTGDGSTCTTKSCECKPGYAPPFCCKCDVFGVINGQRYYRDPETDECLPVCENCVSPTADGRCESCQNNYALPNCCNCTSGHFKSEGICVEPRCPGNVVPDSCTEAGCVCIAGYTGKDCCDCDLAAGYYRAEDRTCKKPRCPGNVVPNSCTEAGCVCIAGYTGKDCCDCDLAAGYYRAEDRTCKKPRCPGNVVPNSCTEAGCVCKAGYTGKDCCDCDLAAGYYRAEDRTCKKPRCPGNVVPDSCTEAGCVCIAGYTGKDCCDCDLAADYYRAEDRTCKKPRCPGNVVPNSCTEAGCVCKAGYKGKDCCDCDEDYYYDTEDETCKKSECFDDRVESCTNGVCICKRGYGGIDCCDVSCTPIQDVYFLLDTTSSYIADNFCKIQYGLMLILGALNPTGSKLTGTRIGTFLLPVLDGGVEDKIIPELRNDPRISTLYMKTDVTCATSIGQIENLIFAIYRSSLNLKFNTDYTTTAVQYVNGELTFPATAIQTLAEYIKNDNKRDPTDERKRVAILLTDGGDDGRHDSAAQRRRFGTLSEAIENINDNADTGIIPVGLNPSSGSERVALRNALEQISNAQSDLDLDTTPIINSDPIELAKSLIRRLQKEGVLCQSQANEALKTLEDSKSAQDFCQCVKKDIYNKAVAETECSQSKKYPLQDMCRASSAQSSSKEVKDSLEEEILAAVEAVLEDRMRGN